MEDKIRIAVSRLHLPDGTILRNQILELKGDRVVDYYDLQEEIYNTIWRGGDYYITSPIGYPFCDV